KNPPNTSVPRTKYTFEVRTSEPASKYKNTPSGGKVYTYTTTTHSRSYEEVPSTRTFAEYREPDKKARRAASYEKPSKRDEEKRERDKEERRRRKEEEEFARLREEKRERERERDKEKERE